MDIGTVLRTLGTDVRTELCLCRKNVRTNGALVLGKL
jgi:hypothetical protein